MTGLRKFTQDDQRRDIALRVKTSDLAAVTGAGLVGVRLPATGATLRALQSKISERVSVKDFGAVGDGVTMDTAAFQAAIDYANSRYIGGSFVGGGVEIHVPDGRYRVGALIIKNGASFAGVGFTATQLLVSGSNVTMFAAAANTSTMLVGANLYYGHFRDMAFYSWEAVNGQLPVNQISWDAVGFSRWQCERIYFGCGQGHTAIRMTGAILAGDGGPTSFYNSFRDCNVEKYYPGTGGVGMLLGDKAADREQVTTWMWSGGSIRGDQTVSGIGINMQSGTGCVFTDVTFEGWNQSIVLGSADGARTANYNTFRDCYWEGNTENVKRFSPAIGNKIGGTFVTGGEFVLGDDGKTDIDLPGQYEKNIVGGTAIDFWRVRMTAGSLSYPQFLGINPRIGIKDEAGNEIIIANNAQTSSANNIYAVKYGGDAYNLFQCGQVSFRIHQSTFELREGATQIISSTGAPEGVIAAPQGSLYLREDGAAGPRFYVKESGFGNTGWVVK